MSSDVVYRDQKTLETFSLFLPINFKECLMSLLEFRYCNTINKSNIWLLLRLHNISITISEAFCWLFCVLIRSSEISLD